MASATIEVWMGEPRTGIWCDGCLTSSRFELNVYRWTSDGPRIIGTVQRCLRCRGDGHA